MFIVDEPEANLTAGPSFQDLDLIPALHEALAQAGYETPTPIQAATIPHLLAGRDVLGQAQTGTGKTAAFALPLLSRIELENNATQVLVLTPTRELAIQVADSFKRYAKHMKGLRVAPIYGGQAYSVQINQLSRGLHVVVGTPGRVMDHMRQGALKIDALRCLVLDEADEMLRMGFVDDVQWILSHTPNERQIALFSATMPPPIRKIADEHLKEPEIVSIDAETIRQRYVILPHRSKFDALTRILEVEQVDGVIVFAKTKVGTVELTEGLQECGFSAIALNGDVPQAQRERAIEQLKSGVVNIIVATDVAARGLDVQRISHVINYDLPFDTEAYVHRIGRTGRAGRSGEAILFVAPTQRGFLRVIERGTSQTLEPMTIPDNKAMNAMRIQRFKDDLTTALSSEPPTFFVEMLKQYQAETNADSLTLAAVLAAKLYGNRSFLIPEERSSRRESESFDRRRSDSSERDSKDRHSKNRSSDREDGFESRRDDRRADRRERRDVRSSSDFETFRVEVGHVHGVKAGNIVGAIANEAGVSSREILNIRIHEDHSTVDLPAGMPREIFKTLGQAWVVGRQLRISKLSDFDRPRSKKRDRDGKPERDAKPDRATSKMTDDAKPRKAKKDKNKKAKSRSPEEQSIFDEAASLLAKIRVSDEP
jgi:ATP-dependent RNA helicase DeaD